jgi:carboxyl-terminal processing protease
MPMLRKSLYIAVGAAAAIALTAAKVAQPAATDTYQELGTLMNVFETVRANYVDKVDDKTLLDGAINGMLGSLDPHSGYLAKSDYEQIKNLTDGEYGGLGLSVTMEDGAVKVIAPTDGTPAARAGVKAGDYITHINGELLYGVTLSEAVEKMRGNAGSAIKITVVRQGAPKPLDFKLVREVIKINPVKSEIKGTVGVIRISSFSKNAGVDTVNALHEIEKKLGPKLTGFILDLRSNPGGVLDEGVDVSAAFLTHGEVVSQRGRDAHDIRRFNAPDRAVDDALGKPLIVLIDEGSASAAEIVAGALQDHRRALVIGERSFGKGSVQSVIPLTPDTGLRLTVARYYTPSNRSVQNGGIEPDIAVPQLSDPERDRERVHESDLRRHLINEVKLDEKAVEDDGKADPRFAGVTAVSLKTAKVDDYQMDYAVKTIARLAAAAAPATVASR